MRISDWSSDVCSSDLISHQGLGRFRESLLDAARRNPHLDKSALDQNLAGAGVGALAEERRRSNRLAFSLTRDEGDSERTAQHLGAVLDVLAALETVETGLNDALRRYQSTLSQEDYDAQQLLRGRKEVLDARLKALARTED